MVRKRQFDFVNYNDVAVIMREEGASLDWDLVTRIAGDVGVGSVLARLLAGAADGLGHRPFPAGGAEGARPAILSIARSIR